MQAEPLIQWPEPISELAGFVALFLAAGAVGFRYAVLRRRLALAEDPIVVADQPVFAGAASRAAILGILGTLGMAVLMVVGLPALAAKKHMPPMQFLTSDTVTTLQGVFLVIAIVGFALAIAKRNVGWHLAAAGVVLGALRFLFVAKWASLVNPVHSLAAGMWIGTLFVLIVAGLSSTLYSEAARERREILVADLVHDFSPAALSMGGVVVLFGLITAWRHLKHVNAIWTTPYGYALVAKLCVVAVVFGLGAFNWRKQRPTLGQPGSAAALRRSATAELVVAFFVLMITAVLVSLPSPK